jgi:hypothetical protein
VQEVGMAKSAQLVGTPAHTEMPLIADFDKKLYYEILMKVNYQSSIFVLYAF